MSTRSLLATISATVLVSASMSAAASRPESYQSVSKFGTTAAQECYYAAKQKRVLREGIAVCDQALDEGVMSTRDRAATFVNRGILKMASHDNDGALSDYNAAIRVLPDLGDAYVNRGLYYMYVGHQDELAIDEINKGLALGTSDESTAYYGRALAYEALDRITEAYYDFKRALELKPGWDLPKKELVRYSVRPKTE